MLAEKDADEHAAVEECGTWEVSRASAARRVAYLVGGVCLIAARLPSGKATE